MLEVVLSFVPVDKLAVHFHDTYGQALANILVSLQPAKVKAFIDRVISIPLHDIVIPLSGFRWEFNKVYCTHIAPDYELHWQKQRQHASTGRSTALISHLITSFIGRSKGNMQAQGASPRGPDCPTLSPPHSRLTPSPLRQLLLRHRRLLPHPHCACSSSSPTAAVFGRAVDEMREALNEHADMVDELPLPFQNGQIWCHKLPSPPQAPLPTVAAGEATVGLSVERAIDRCPLEVAAAAIGSAAASTVSGVVGGDDLDEEDKGFGCEIGTFRTFKKAKGTVNISVAYNTRNHDIESSVIARGGWRHHAAVQILDCEMQFTFLFNNCFPMPALLPVLHVYNT